MAWIELRTPGLPSAFLCLFPFALFGVLRGEMPLVNLREIGLLQLPRGSLTSRRNPQTHPFALIRAVKPTLDLMRRYNSDVFVFTSRIRFSWLTHRSPSASRPRHRDTSPSVG